MFCFLPTLHKKVERCNRDRATHKAKVSSRKAIKATKANEIYKMMNSQTVTEVTGWNTSVSPSSRATSSCCRMTSRSCCNNTNSRNQSRQLLLNIPSLNHTSNLHMKQGNYQESISILSDCLAIIRSEMNQNKLQQQQQQHEQGQQGGEGTCQCQQSRRHRHQYECNIQTQDMATSEFTIHHPTMVRGRRSCHG